MPASPKNYSKNLSVLIEISPAAREWESLQGTSSAPFCFECEHYPCAQIDRLDRRYSKSYGVSVKDNLEAIRTRGLSAFVEEQRGKYRCGKCAGTISVHNGKCFACEEITRLVEKNHG